MYLSVCLSIKANENWKGLLKQNFVLSSFIRWSLIVTTGGDIEEVQENHPYCTSRSLGRESLHAMHGQEEMPGFGQVADDRSKESIQARAFIGVSIGKARQGNSTELSSLNNWGLGQRSIPQVVGPGMINGSIGLIV